MFTENLDGILEAVKERLSGDETVRGVVSGVFLESDMDIESEVLQALEGIAGIVLVVSLVQCVNAGQEWSGGGAADCTIRVTALEKPQLRAMRENEATAMEAAASVLEAMRAAEGFSWQSLAKSINRETGVLSVAVDFETTICD